MVRVVLRQSTTAVCRNKINMKCINHQMVKERALPRMVVQRCRASRSTRARGCRQDQVGKAAKTMRLGIVVKYFTEARVFIAFEKHFLL